MAKTTAVLRVALTVAFAPHASADTLHVSQGGEGYPTIASAFAAMSSGDSVVVHPGVYFEHDLVMPVRGFLVSYDGDPSTTIVDAGGLGRCLTIAGGGLPLPEVRAMQFRNGTHASRGGLVAVDVVARLTGCVFRGGTAPSGGGVSLAASNHAFFHDCLFEGNSAATGGALSGHLEITGCEFRDNVASGSGGAVWGNGTSQSCRFVANRAVLGSGGAVFSPLFWSAERCDFLDNSAASAGALRLHQDDAAVDCLFLGNRASGSGGAILVSDELEDGTLMMRCVFARNVAGSGGAVALVDGANGVFIRCTFVANSARDGAHVFGVGPSVVASMWLSILAFSDGPAGGGNLIVPSTSRCNDVYGNVPGDGVFSVLATQNGGFAADPRFCDAGTDDYRLAADSPCLPPGPTACGLVGALDVGCGSVPVVPDTWGRIKGAFR